MITFVFFCKLVSLSILDIEEDHCDAANATGKIKIRGSPQIQHLTSLNNLNKLPFELEI
jgi:hypothetical protein